MKTKVRIQEFLCYEIFQKGDEYTKGFATVISVKPKGKGYKSFLHYGR